jgi:hypothetical protein
MEALPGAMEVLPGAMEAVPGAIEASPVVMWFTLALRMLALEPLRLEGSSWSFIDLP